MTSHKAGYALQFPDGDRQGPPQAISYRRAHTAEKKWAKQKGKLMAYLTCPKLKGNKWGPAQAKHTITSWPGGVFSDRVLLMGTKRDNFGGERTYLRFAMDGQIWSGYAMGCGMYGRFKRTSLKSLLA